MPSPTNSYRVQTLAIPDEWREPPVALTPPVCDDDEIRFYRLDGRPVEHIAPAPNRRVRQFQRRPRRRVRQSHRTRPGHRRSGATSTTASSDPGDDGPLDNHAPVMIRGVACPHCTQPLHSDRAGADHCGGCGISWWEGVR